MSAVSSRTGPILVPVAVALGVGLLAAGVAPVASAATVETVDITLAGPPSDDYDITLQRVVGDGSDEGWPWGSQPGSYLELTVTTLSGLPQEFGLGADLH